MEMLVGVYDEYKLNMSRVQTFINNEYPPGYEW